MTREQIAAKIAEQMTRKGSVPTSDKKDYLWKPPIGKASIRVLPSKYFRKELFAELLVHFEIGNKSMMCLTNFGEKDPIVEFIQQLRKTPEWKSANKLEPKNRVFLPIIVRGEEDKGVRLWEFGKQIFLDLLRNMDDEDLNDITDPINGHDVTIDTTSPDQNGTKFNQSRL